METPKPSKYQPMSEACEVFLTYAMKTLPEKPVALDDAYDLIGEFIRKGAANRKNFVSVFGPKSLQDMEEASDFADFWEGLRHELNQMELELGDHCPWLVTILGISWVEGWQNVRTQPLTEREKAEQVEKWNKGTWGKTAVHAVAQQDAENGKDEDEDTLPIRGEGDEDDADAELEEVA